MSEQPDLSVWIGRKDADRVDHITPRLQDSFAATFDPHLADATLGLHWCLSPPLAKTAELGADGHPQKGSFLPPVPLPRRMWASGDIQFHMPLHVGDEVTKQSQIKDIFWKSGNSGTLCFVTVTHRYDTSRGLAVQEDQNIVYRAEPTGPAEPTKLSHPMPHFDRVEDVAITPTLLFRYSALTFNGHRIHYDVPYAKDTEFYDDLVIHGPLQATLVMNLAAKSRSTPLTRFTYRGQAPASGAQTLALGLSHTDDGAQLAVISEGGITTMTAMAQW